jgi:hypothetical protein
MPEMIGGCLCGKVRYTMTADPVLTGVCHCRNCQKQSGAAFSTNLAIPVASFTLHGATKVYHNTGGSGRSVLVHFCGDCGSPLYTEAEAMPGVVIVKAGTLDDPSPVRPSLEIFCDSAQPWVHLDGDRTRFPRMRG